MTRRTETGRMKTLLIVVSMARGRDDAPSWSAYFCVRSLDRLSKNEPRSPRRRFVVCDFCDDWTVDAICSSTGLMKKIFSLVVLLASCMATVSLADGEEFVGGTFEGRVVAEWSDDPFIPTMRLKEELLFRQTAGDT